MTLDRITCARCGEPATITGDAFMCASKHVTFEISTLEADAAMWLAWRYEWMRQRCEFCREWSGDDYGHAQRAFADCRTCLGRGWLPLQGAEALAVVIRKMMEMGYFIDHAEMDNTDVTWVWDGPTYGSVPYNRRVQDPIAACLVAARRALEGAQP